MKLSSVSISIGDVVIRIESEIPFTLSTKARPFITDKITYDILLNINIGIDVNLNDYTEISHKENISVYENKRKCLRVKYNKDNKIIDWILVNKKSDPYKYELLVNSKEYSVFETLNPLFFYDITLLFSNFDSFILHSSFIKYKNCGLLFTGPSGIGKTTQAMLWNKYKCAKVINGDRTIIRKKDGYYAYGSPYAGSSNLYINESAPLVGIIVLKQALNNNIHRLDKKEAYLHLLSQTSVSSTNKQVVEKQSLLLSDLINSVPVYLLECLPNKDAVEILYRELGDFFD